MNFARVLGWFKVDLKDKYSGPVKDSYSSWMSFLQVSKMMRALDAFMNEIRLVMEMVSVSFNAIIVLCDVNPHRQLLNNFQNSSVLGNQS